ncbi:hypothetical protein QKW60_10740 [Defluviimonas aestuarii]|uniref:hypothetical protein n=1 Tax=Albidovulum aestuarii TaxID=1130726 RepID=UPI00249C161D|nr:hypothetical protein [Defluviimonas aestuarii]MDI3336887.1 hypothetical protein [Defluviimonas aestuarii]
MKEQTNEGPATGPFVTQPTASKKERIADGVTQARLRLRHRGMLILFAVWVVLPLIVAAFYLYFIAEDQYESRVGFSVRKEETSSPVELLGGITELSGNSSSDTDFLYKYIRGRQMMLSVDAKLNLREVYTRPADPVFALKRNASVEEMEDYWSRVVKVFYDTADGLIEVRVVAFSPEDAKRIAQEIFDEGSRKINELTAIARDDSTRYAEIERDRAIERLKVARQALTAFRIRTQIVDPEADIEGRMGLLNTLQTQLATALIDLDLLLNNTNPGDPRIVQTQQRIEVIEDRISEERNHFSTSSASADIPYSSLVGEYEGLLVDLKFAEESYIASLAAYEAAFAEAQRQSRYLAPYVSPTLAEISEFPQRATLLALTGGFLFITWAIAVLIFYSIRDRR